MFRARARDLAVSLVLAALGACAEFAPMPQGQPSVGGFDLSGRVAVRYGEETASGRVQWRHEAGSDDLLITNPLGQGVARITRSAGEFGLQTSDGSIYRAADAESLTGKVLGWRLPLEGLPQWVRAEALPGRPAQITRDASRRVSELRQDAWRIEYEDYENGHPRRMRLTRPDLEIRLVIESFSASGS